MLNKRFLSIAPIWLGIIRRLRTARSILSHVYDKTTTVIVEHDDRMLLYIV
jgi:translation initiation factor RLI1